MSSDDEIQDIDRSEDIGYIIATEVCAQLAVLLSAALKTVLPSLLNKELSQHSEVGESHAESSQPDQNPEHPLIDQQLLRPNYCVKRQRRPRKRCGESNLSSRTQQGPTLVTPSHFEHTRLEV